MTDFSAQDIEQITAHGLTTDAVRQQMDDFAHGFPFADIVAPATIGNGIAPFDAAAMDMYDTEYRNAHKIVKFVPASGAATRMFKDLFEFLNTGVMNDVTQTVLDNLERFAFYDELKQYITPTSTPHDVISAIVGTPGLNYGTMPKGLIPFHKYLEHTRTPATEHMDEGIKYAMGGDNVVNIHFTVSPEHRNDFTRMTTDATTMFADENASFNITMSEQMSATDTIAVNPDNTPFRDEDGRLVFRPAGHGALIENLNQIDADIIFIKNIDNVCTVSNGAPTTESKIVLAGKLINIQKRIFDYIARLDATPNDASLLNEIADFIENTLCVRGVAHDADAMRRILNRPTRVCGVVKNSGAPGGGPFLVRGSDGIISPQIVESSQIAPDARNIMNDATHFNPVDLVCAVRDVNGKKFDLIEFIDPTTGFISEKSKNGRPLRAMERPGLWNGAMANWNTIFMEVSPKTFNPVKVVSDLLKPAHQDA